MDELVAQNGNCLSIEVTRIEEVVKQAQEYVRSAKASNTIKSYRADWDDFVEWCGVNQYINIPATAQTVSFYITTLALRGLKISTIQRRISAISQAHKAADQQNPTHSHLVRTVWAGIRREHYVAQKGKKALVIDDIRMIMDAIPSNLLGVRDRALLLIGFSGAFRRSELVSLNVNDLEFTQDGLVINLRKSKTDQEGQGRKIGIPFGSRIETCPIRSLQEWLEASGITDGPIFRPINRHTQIQNTRLSDKAVALVVKRYAEAAGLDSSQYAGHSLRAGFATSAAMANVSERSIMKQTGHKSESMVRRYIRDGSLFQDNAAAKIEL